MPIEDIYGTHSEITLWRGWHELESHAGTSFRWARSNAECMVFTFVPARQRVSFDLEPGPGVSGPEFTLTVFDANGERRFREQFSGRKTVALTLSASGPAVHLLRLHVEGGGAVGGQDPRALDFRVFRIGVQAEPGDVVPIASGCRVGAGWYPLELWEGARFRWVDNDARIVVESAAATRVELELEPGPGTAGRPLDLHATECGGRHLASFRLRSRERIAVPLPPEIARPFEVILHGEGGGSATPGEARMLNFRAFCECT